MRRLYLTLLVATPLWLTACDQLGIESATVVSAKRDAEGRAVGGGCRQAARSVEQCYGQNKKADRAAVFAGWRDMNDYMRENKLEAQPAPEAPVTTVAAADDADEAADPKDGKDGKETKGGKSKAGAKH